MADVIEHKDGKLNIVEDVDEQDSLLKIVDQNSNLLERDAQGNLTKEGVLTLRNII